MLPTDPSEPLTLGLLQSGLLRRGDRVLVAVSGGPDSTALLVAAHEQGHDVVAAHYDHALRPGSDRDSEAVAGLCARLGVALITERRQDPLASGSVQAAARTAAQRSRSCATRSMSRPTPITAPSSGNKPRTISNKAAPGRPSSNPASTSPPAPTSATTCLIPPGGSIHTSSLNPSFAQVPG